MNERFVWDKSGMNNSQNQCYSVEALRRRIEDQRYIVDKFIGEGGMSCVYRAKERGTPNVYALKLLKEAFRQDKDFLDIFEREASNMRDLQYPNIVRYYRFVIEKQSAYIIMEYVDGNPLTSFIKHMRRTEQDFPLGEVVRIMVQVARAVAYLHQEGYIHYDLKPGNVLLRRTDGRAYLTDLGITGAFGGEVLTGAGTPSYMPYEQQIGMDANHTVDIYSFGIMSFEMLAGRKPFVAPRGGEFNDMRDQLIRMHRYSPVPSIREYRPELPPEVDAIFERALAKTPGDRYQDILQFAKDFHQAVRHLLSDDLQDFENIQPRRPVSDPDLRDPFDPQPTPFVPPRDEEAAARTSSTRWVVLLGSGAIGLIVLLVAVGILANLGLFTPSPTLTPSPEATQEALVEQTTEATLPAFASEDESSGVAQRASEVPDAAAQGSPPMDTPTVTESATVRPTNTPTLITTATESPTDTPTERPSETATLTHTPTASITPSATATPTPTATYTALPSPTPVLFGLEPLTIADGVSALGFDEYPATLSELLAYLVSVQGDLVPLALGADANGFLVELALAAASLEQYRYYGIAFRVQDDANYWAWRISPAEQSWQLVSVVAGQERIVETQPLVGEELPSYLAVRGHDGYLTLQAGLEAQPLPVEYPQMPDRGKVALVLASDTPEAIQVQALEIGVLLPAEAASQSDPTPVAPALLPMELLLEDLQALLATADIDRVECENFVIQYERLSLHNLRPELASYVEQAQLASSPIYNRCLRGLEALFGDLVAWEGEMNSLIETIRTALDS